MRWEYKTVQVAHDSDLDTVLNEQGADGWEVFHIGEFEKNLGREVRFKKSTEAQYVDLSGLF